MSFLPQELLISLPETSALLFSRPPFGCKVRLDANPLHFCRVRQLVDALLVALVQDVPKVSATGFGCLRRVWFLMRVYSSDSGRGGNGCFWGASGFGF